MLQMMRYTFVGGLSFIVDYGSLFLLTEYLGVYYLFSALIAFCLGLAVNYLISISWVFSKTGDRNIKKEIILFAFIGLFGLAFNEAVMFILSELMGINYLLSKLFSVVIVFFLNFFGRKYLLSRI